MSGNKAFIAKNTGTNLRTGAFVKTTAASGGTVLAASGTYTPFGVYIKNVSYSGYAFTSGAVHIGSSGNPPYASGGYILLPGEKELFNIERPDFIRVFSYVSGTAVSWYGIDH